jgi:hypothetical protein
MKKREAGAALQKLIQEQEALHKASSDLLSAQFHITYESLKPANLIKKTIHDLVAGPDLRKDLVSAAMGMSAGYLTEKIFSGHSHNMVKKISGMILGRLVAQNVTHNAEELKEIGVIMLRKLFTRTVPDNPEGDSKPTT